MTDFRSDLPNDHGDDQVVLAHRIATLLQNDRVGLAKTHLRDALRRFPNSEWLIYYRASVELREGDDAVRADHARRHVRATDAIGIRSAGPVQVETAEGARLGSPRGGCCYCAPQRSGAHGSKCWRPPPSLPFEVCNGSRLIGRRLRELPGPPRRAPSEPAVYATRSTAMFAACHFFARRRLTLGSGGSSRRKISISPRSFAAKYGARY